MNSEREQAYLNLINQLLTCPSGEEAQVLETYPELLDDGLVAAMLEEADRLLRQGARQNDLSQFREALQSWEQALAIYREIGNRQAEAGSLGNLGLVYYSLGQYQKAIEFHQQSLEISREIGYRQGEAAALGNLGLVYYSLGQYQKAIEFHQQHLEISREIGDRQGEANSLGNLGNAYYSLGQFQRAIEFHQQHLEISREIGYRQGESASLGNLGVAYYSLEQYHRAIEFHQQSLEISREIGYRQAEANSLNGLGLAYSSLGQYQRAIEFHQQSLEISREIGYRQAEANSLCNLGLAYSSLGPFHRAIEFHQQSLEISREMGNRQGEANSLNGLGLAYSSLGQYHRAIEFHQQHLEISREIGSRQGEAASLCNLGLAYQSRGQYQRAIEFHQQSLQISREIGSRQGEADSLNGLGLAYQSRGQYQRAIEFHEQQLEISREIGSRQGEADSLNGLGLVYKSLGQYHKAIEFHEQQLEISREIGSRQREAASLGNLGGAYYFLGKYYRAIEFHEQQLEISREIGSREAEAISLGNLGAAYYSLGQYHRAIEFYQQQLEISREIGYRQGEAISLGNLGIAYYDLGQYHRAIDFQEQSLVIRRKIGDSDGEAISLGNLGNAYYSLRLFDTAIKFQEQSLQMSREIGNRQLEANSVGNLGLAYESLGQYQRAIEFYQQQLEISREIGYPKGEATSLGNLGITYHFRGQFHKKIKFLEQSLMIKREIGDRVGEAGSLCNLGNAYYQVSNGLRMCYKRLPKILTFFVKKIFILWEHFYLEQAEFQLRASIQIYETLRYELVNNDQKASIFENQVSAYRNLQQVLVAQTKFDEALEISEMSRTRAFVELLQQTLLTNDLPANDKTDRLSIPQIQQIARDRNSTIVEYSIIFHDIYIWVIQPNGHITHRAANLEPLNQQNQTLKQIILKARVSIGTNETDDEGNKIQLESQYNRDETGRFPLLQLLHQILIEPIIDLLPVDANSPIIFVPHYDLFLVPFAALQDSNNRYLIENHTILTSPSIKVLEITREHQNRVRGLRQAALIVGDPTIAPKFNENPYKLRQIPRAKEAAEAIAATLGTEAISGENATKVAILDRMLNTRIVHLSAHGLLDDFQGSGIPGAIILAPSGDTDDGALNAAEILRLKLDSELVVLSACSTGGGKITGDGVIGLSRCFILAGVPSIIVSLWNMGAISAKLLMTEFYENLARGENRAAALRCAMLTTKARFPSPIAWAAFTLIGETETLPLSTEKSDLRRLVMSLPDDATPEEIVAAFSKLLKISEPQFVKQLSAIDVGSTYNINIIAQTIKDWCETRSQIEENLENEIYQMGAGGGDSDAPEEIVREFYKTLNKNQIRLGLPLSSPPPAPPTNNSQTPA